MTGSVTWVTGAEGFVGSWLLPGLTGQASLPLQRPGGGSSAGYRELELSDRDAVHALMRETRPARIVQLAAIAFPPEAARSPLEALRCNYCAIDHLLSGMAAHAPEARLLYVSTGAAYGAQPADHRPLVESDPLEPQTPYAATKAAAEQRVALAAEAGLDVVRARPFNHSGPGRPADYAESAFARQIVQIERGEREPVLRVGNLDAVRDYSDVRDVVDAYCLLLERGERGGVYNVCSGRGRSVRSIVETLLSLSGCGARIEVDPDLYRPAASDRLALVGDAGRLRSLGWQPTHTFEDTLKDLLEDWRSRA